MQTDHLSVLIATLPFALFTAHVALDNALAAVRWVRSRG